jgi:DNA polymerase-1
MGRLAAGASISSGVASGFLRDAPAGGGCAGALAEEATPGPGATLIRSIHHRLSEQHPAARMLLQVHDELVFEVPAGEIEEARALVKQLMESAFELTVPLEVITGIGQNWFECK